MYKIPGSQENVNQNEYIDWYRKTAKPIEKATGARLYGFDPDFSFRWERTTINLPTSFVVKLSQIFTKEAAEGD